MEVGDVQVVDDGCHNGKGELEPQLEEVCSIYAKTS